MQNVPFTRRYIWRMMCSQCDKNNQKLLFFENQKGTIFLHFLFFFFNIRDEERDCGFFQQDGAAAHTAFSVIPAFRKFWGEQISRHLYWPARSPDLTTWQLPIGKSKRQRILTF